MVQKSQNVSYGLTQPLNLEAQLPIVSQRDPGANDKSQLGTMWVNKSTNAYFVLTSIVNNAANWASGAGGIGDFTALLINPGDITVTDGDITVQNGFVRATGFNATTNGLEVDLGGVFVADGDVQLSNGNVIVDVGSIQATGGAITAAGNISSTAGGLFANAQVSATTFLQTGGTAGPTIKSGAGSPVGVVTSAQGSLYMNTTGSAVDNRLWINTNGGTAWTFVTTGA